MEFSQEGAAPRVPRSGDSSHHSLAQASSFISALETRQDLDSELSRLEGHYMSEVTRVYNLTYRGHAAIDDEFNDKQLLESLDVGDPKTLKFFAIAESDSLPKLCITPQCFRAILSRFDAPVGFITALSRHWQTCGTGVRFLSNSPGSWDHWCLIPSRVRVPCKKEDSDKAHKGSQAGSNQMDPFNYIHLKDVGEDIRGSHVALFVRHNSELGATTVMSINFQDQRWRHFIQAPLYRVKSSLSTVGSQPDPISVHVAYLDILLEWWNDVLYTFNKQLISEEYHLQKDLEDSSAALPTSSAAINKRLHTMAAHLYRYGSELDRVKDIADQLHSLHRNLQPTAQEEHNGSQTYDSQTDHVLEWNRVAQGLEQILSQMTALRSFRQELERKTSNILALLFNNMQVINDQRMQDILQATQEETRRSQDLAKSMKEDSIAMKTIALLTMCFLPGTSFAAILSMPFFSTNKYLTTASRMWIWVLLTIPSTLVGLYIYTQVMRRKRQELGLSKDEEAPRLPSNNQLAQ